MSDTECHLRAAIDLALANVRSGGRPFGAVLVQDGEVVATGVNEILRSGDPTAHAELLAVRAASQKLGTPRLDGSVVYASGQPCPMCMAAMRLAGVSVVYFAYSNEDGEPHGLSTAALAAELARPPAEQTMAIRHLPVRPSDGTDLYAEWSHRQAR